jgi:antitoxin MazE
MIKHLIKHGNSHALLLDKAVLELLKINPETTPVDIATDGNALLITPVRDKKKQKELTDTLAKIDSKYSDVFKRLAKK